MSGKIKVNMDDFGAFLNSTGLQFAVTDRRKLTKIQRSGENMAKMNRSEFEAGLKALKTKFEYVPGENVVKVSRKGHESTIRYEEAGDE